MSTGHCSIYSAPLAINCALAQGTSVLVELCDHGDTLTDANTCRLRAVPGALHVCGMSVHVS